MRTIIEGIVIGCSSEVILTIFHHVMNLRKRYDQVKFIKKIIHEGRCRVLSKETQQRSIGTHAITPNEYGTHLRIVYFEHMCREMKSALDGRTSRMKYEQVHELRSLFFRILDRGNMSTCERISTCFGLLTDPDHFLFLKMPELSRTEFEMLEVFPDTPSE